MQKLSQSVLTTYQTNAKWQTFEKPENKRQMYGSQSTQALLSYK